MAIPEGEENEPEPTCTWAEFKKEVEARGVKDADQLAYIDWEPRSWAMKVQRFPGGQVKIT
jgi:hypothetical protein